MTKRAGFTLVELIIVMVILAALAGAVIPAFSANRNQARQARIQADLGSLKSAMYVYRSDTGSYPATIAALSAAGGVSGYNGPYLDVAAPVDPCGTAYTYAAGPPRTVSTGAASTCPATTLQVAQN